MTSAPDTTGEQRVHWSQLAARGPDARAFLQGQLSCDLSTLNAGERATGLLLTPSGDVVTSVRCEVGDDAVDLVIRRELADSTLAALRRFLLRTRCTLELGGEATGDYATVREQVTLGDPGPAEFSRQLTPHTFGQAFVDAHVSFTKGCFTGQELVGRLDARGARVPFRLARVRGDSLEHVESVVRAAGPSGERTRQGVSTWYVDGDVHALAIVHRSLLGDATNAVLEGVAVEILHG